MPSAADPHSPDQAVIVPQRGRGDEALPPACILVFTPQDMVLLRNILSGGLKKARPICLAEVYRAGHGGVPFCFAGPLLGAPQAALVMEKLIALGVVEIISLGWCGSLQPKVRIGEVVLADAAVSEEGTSAHYLLEGARSMPSEALFGLVSSTLRADQWPIHEGTVWSTDAPFRETASKVRKYQAAGVLAVDMETSALFSVARFRGIQVASVLVVSDDLSSLDWHQGFKDPAFQAARDRALHLLVKVVSRDRSIGP